MKTLRTLALLLGVVTAQAFAAPAAPDGFYLVEDEPAAVVSSFKAVPADKTFSKTLSRWATNAGWKVSWELESEYSFSYPADFGADFIPAVDGLCASLNSSGIRARAIAYEENKVVRIVLEGTQR
jgi:hypothetical protein